MRPPWPAMPRTSPAPWKSAHIDVGRPAASVLCDGASQHPARIRRETHRWELPAQSDGGAHVTRRIAPLLEPHTPAQISEESLGMAPVGSEQRRPSRSQLPQKLLPPDSPAPPQVSSSLRVFA